MGLNERTVAVVEVDGVPAESVCLRVCVCVWCGVVWCGVRVLCC